LLEYYQKVSLLSRLISVVRTIYYCLEPVSLLSFSWVLQLKMQFLRVGIQHGVKMCAAQQVYQVYTDRSLRAIRDVRKPDLEKQVLG
jgi:hypothetical protein